VQFEIIRDPLWNNIRVDSFTMRLVDTAVVQRLRYVRQLGLAYLVYPGATHSRFEHALGTYHLTRRTLALLEERKESALDADGSAVVLAAALLHDVGHYPFSHALEEIGAPHHEDLAEPLVTTGEVARLLAAELGPTAPRRVGDLIRGTSASPLQGLISGSLDLDKIDYLKRDAWMCGVPYGEIDVDRLMNSLVLLADPDSGAPTIGVVEKGLAALESLLFAKYQMYRNVYWHHAVRSATAMYKRLVGDALTAGVLEPRTIVGFTDEGLLDRLADKAPSSLLAALRGRRLYKRALEWPAADLPDGAGEWVACDRALAVAAEDYLADKIGVARGDLLLDYPAKTQMLGLDIPVRRRSGVVERLTTAGMNGSINLPSLSDELYQSARGLRVFTANRLANPKVLPADETLSLLSLPADRVRSIVLP
jgi:HD superfamily phosphohydrolase